MGHYQVLFSGEIAHQTNQDVVRAGLARELGIDERKARQLFSGRTVVIRSQLDRDEAFTLQERLAGLGAICRVKDLTPQREDRADYYRAEKERPEHTLRDITAAHVECPRCGHFQLEVSHCAHCGVDIAAAMKQKHKEDLIIEKKIRELRDQKLAAAGPVRPESRRAGALRPSAARSGDASRQPGRQDGGNTRTAARDRIAPEGRGISKVMSWLRKSP